MIQFNDFKLIYDNIKYRVDGRQSTIMGNKTAVNNR